MPQKYVQPAAPAAPNAPPGPEPIPFGSRQDQTERRHPGAEKQPTLEERRKTDEVGGED